jgi:hypothetical protein
MMSEIVVALSPAPRTTRVLAIHCGQEVLRAVLGPPCQMHSQAAPRLLEGLALWYQRPVRVVLCVDEPCDGYDLSLSDTFGFGGKALHYEVDIVPLRADRRRSTRLPGRGDFGDVRAALRHALGAP